MIGRIESRTNAKVKHLRKLGTSRSYRYECKTFLCDGMKLLDEAYRSNAVIRQVFVEESKLDTLLCDRAWLNAYPVYAVPETVFASMSSLDSPQAVLFECEMNLCPFACAPRMVLLDHLQDVGNIGTVIRTADAFSVSGVVLDGCADPYNPKTVRAAMGSIFRVPVMEADLLDVIETFDAEKIPVYAAVLSDRAEDVRCIDLTNAAVIIGNEGAGVRKELAERVKNLIIPMSGQTESLNAAVAASILIWQMS